MNFRIVIVSGNLFIMPWFESKEEKQQRLTVQGKMKLCLTKPERYPEAMNIISTFIKASNQNVIEMVVDHIKEVIKDDDRQPFQKYQAILLLKDLMETHNKALGKYVVKKILKRLIIFAKHRQQSSDEDRGKNIFQNCKKLKQEKYGINFLNTLLLALQEWASKWPKTVDGPHQQFLTATNELLMGGVTFPKAKKKKTMEPMKLKKSGANFQQSNATQIKPVSPQELSHKNEPLPKEIQTYFMNLYDALKTFIVVMEENSEFSEMWGLIKEIIREIKQLIQQGDFFMAKLINEEKGETVVFQIFQKNLQFLRDLQKNVTAVDKKNEKYSQFRSIEIRQTKKILNRLAIHLKDKDPPSMKNSKSKIVPKTEEAPKVEKAEKFEKAEKEEEKPKIKPKNRFDSTNNFQHQLEIIKKEKEDFNSGSLSQQSGKFGSIGGEHYNKNRFAAINNPKQSEKQNEDEEKKQKKPQLASISKITEKNQSMIQGSKENLQKQAEIEVKVVKQHSFSLSNIQKNQQDPSQQKKEEGFDDFEGFEAPNKKGDDSSDFFKEEEKKKEMRVRNKEKIKKHEEKQKDFFDISMKSKVDEVQNSAFGKEESKAESKKSESKSGEAMEVNFHTFKNTGNLGFPKNKIKTQEIEKEEKSQKNPFQNTEERRSENPFEEKTHEIGVFSKVNKKEEDLFESKNPFSSHQHSQTSQKSKLSNPFDEKSISGKSENPFEKSITKSENQNVSQGENPFERTIVKQENPFEKSASRENFFEKTINKSENPLEKSEMREDPIMEKQMMKEENPFEKSMYKSENPFEKSSKKEDISMNENPFEEPTEKENSNADEIRKSPTFDLFEKSLTKNQSFKNIKKDQIQKQSGSSMENPFEFANKQSQNIIANLDPLRQSGFQFINVNKETVDPIRNSLELRPKENVRESVRDSFDGFRGSFGANKSSVKGFDFEEFGNFNKSNSSLKQSGVKESIKEQSQNVNKSQIQFEDFGDFGVSVSKDKKDENQMKENKNFFDEKKSFQKSQKRDSFNLSDFNDLSKEKQTKKQNFFSDTIQFNKEKDVWTEEFEKPKEEQKRQQKGEKKGDVKEKSVDEDWKKFANFGDQSNVSITSSRFEEEESKKKEEKAEEEIRFSQFQEQESDLKRKNMENSKEQFGVRFSQFQEPEFKTKFNQGDNISEIAEANNDVNLGTIRQLKHDLQKNGKEKPEEESISINFEDGSPKKKGIKWNYNLSFFPSSYRRKVNQEEFQRKKQVLQSIKITNMKKIAEYQRLKQLENQAREHYHQKLQKISLVHKQKYSYTVLLNRMKETNELRQKEIEEVMKRIKRGEEIRKLILEKEKLLFDRHKAKEEMKSSMRVQSKNKWERFNNNLQKQKSLYQESFISHKQTSF